MRHAQPSALSTPDDVITLAEALNRLADKLHEALRRLTGQATGDTTLAYALLTEEYALRARTNILRNDAHRHTLDELDFGQTAMMHTFDRIEADLQSARTLEEIRSIASDLITFASSITPGKARVMNFLAKELGIQR